MLGRGLTMASFQATGHLEENRDLLKMAVITAITILRIILTIISVSKALLEILIIAQKTCHRSEKKLFWI